MEAQHIFIIIITLVFSALFSGMEIAYLSADKLQIELGNQQGRLSDKIISKFLKRPSWFISTILIGNNIALVIYGIFMAYLLIPVIGIYLPPEIHYDWLELLIQSLIATTLVLVVAEFTPKSLFMIKPNRMLAIFSVLFYAIYILLYPAVWTIAFLSKILLKNVFKLEYSEKQPVFGLTDLNHFIVSNVSKSEEKSEQEVYPKIFTNALEFKSIKVRECMVPRTEIEAVDIEDSIAELREAFIKSGFSKILVYKESIDNIIGYCNSLELFKKPNDIESILIPIIIVPETILASEVMIQFITMRKSIALVVDEFGGTSGIVTIEDIIEEIFGDIQDEHDEDDLVEIRVNDTTYIFSGRQEIDYLNEKYSLELPIGDYDTIGGLILSVNKDFPDVNDEIDLGRYSISILSIEENRIDKVKLTLNQSGTSGS